MKAIGGMAGMLYVAVTGAGIGFKLFGTVGSIGGYVLLSFLGVVSGWIVGPVVGSRLARFMGVSG
ncbi:MAG: hypothetical protein WAM60_08705 [Candidatus Promineifilaceae bacterium]